MPHPFGSVQRAIMNRLADAPARPGSDVFDLRRSRGRCGRALPDPSEIAFGRISAGLMLGEMSTAAGCPRVTLTIEISEVLYSALAVTATMSATTLPAFIGLTLRQTQITFFAEAPGTSECDVAVLDVRAAPPSTNIKATESVGFSSPRVNEGHASAPERAQPASEPPRHRDPSSPSSGHRGLRYRPRAEPGARAR